MKLRTIYLLARERLNRITPAEHFELLAVLRTLDLTIVEALEI